MYTLTILTIASMALFTWSPIIMAAFILIFQFDIDKRVEQAAKQMCAKIGLSPIQCHLVNETDKEKKKMAVSCQILIYFSLSNAL